MNTRDQGTDQQPRSLVELARDYRLAKDAADAARESVKPATKAAKEAKDALVAALKAVGTPVVVDGHLYRIQGNGQFAEDDVQVLED